jgi:hypothetical protein
MEKDNKKKTLTISSDLKKKIDTSSISTDGKKSFAVKKKEPFRGNKNTTDQVRILIHQKPKILKRKILQENLLNNKQLKPL